MVSPQRDKVRTYCYVVNVHELEPDLDENSFRKVLRLGEVKILRETYYLITPENSQSRRLSFGHTIVYPRGRTTGHAHPDLEEIYFYIQGRGEMQIDNDIFPVKEGDAVYIPAGSYHVTYNTGIVPIRFVWATFKLTNCINNDGEK
jgi:mannose-6-phosphate isomerase-like protein (cupin superfamily)